MHMETTTIKTTQTNRSAAVNGLAIVGFIVLVIIGMILAVYAARFVPTAISNIGSAAVYLSSEVFPSGDGDGDLVVVPPTDTVPFPEDPVVETPVATTTVPVEQPANPVRPAPAQPTVVAVPVPGTYAPLTGLPDLVIENVTTGYLTSSNTSSFRASDEVPEGRRGAIRFSVANRGTNMADRFEFEVKLPTSPSYTYESSRQPELRPGARIEFVLGFDQPRSGSNREIEISIDSGRDVRESNENNNERTVRIDIER